MCLKRERKYGYTIWRYTGEANCADDALLLEDEGIFWKKRDAIRRAKIVRKECVRETDVIVVRKIPTEKYQKYDENDTLKIEEWVIKKE